VVTILAARAKSKGKRGGRGGRQGARRKDERNGRDGEAQRARCLSASLFTFLLFFFTSSVSASTSLSSLRGTPARC
jgi:hypothetical protein